MIGKRTSPNPPDTRVSSKTVQRQSLAAARVFSPLLALAWLAGSGIFHAAETVAPRILETLEISKVPAGFPVGFSLLTAGKKQYVAYYDKDSNMTVASRALDSKKWDYQILPSKVKWDSHNSIAMAMDDEGQLHLSGNMHAVPLVYFRTQKAGDIRTFKKFPMTGKLENRVTYPVFLKDNQGNLIFNYRDGGSGNGNTIYNKYDIKNHAWSRLLDAPLLDGEGQCNAYPSKPVPGPDGYFHMLWVWRDTPDCATNHHLSYARSKDLVHWESTFGKAVPLPMKLGDKELWVDPIPSGGGIINGGAKLNFDNEKRPLISYHKSDTAGNMQIYAARPENGAWALHLLTDWKKPVHFSGNGSMGPIGIGVGGLETAGPDLLTLTYSHRDYGSGRLVLDDKTLTPIEKKIVVSPTLPRELGKIESDFQGMGIMRADDQGDSGDPAVKYVLQWETLGANRDRPRQPPLPEPSTLKLHKISRP